MTKTNTTTVWGETYTEDGVSVRAAVRLDFDLTAQYQDEAYCLAHCVLSVSSEQCSEEQEFLTRFSLCSFSDRVFWEVAEYDGFGVPDDSSFVNPYDFDSYDAMDVHGSYLRFAIETAIASACEKAESAARDFLRDALENKSDVQIVYESSGFPFWAVYETVSECVDENLFEEDRKVMAEWFARIEAIAARKGFRVTYYQVSDKDNGFNAHPEFGRACETVNVRVWGEKLESEDRAAA